jgi:hypothetical protein
LSPSFLKIPHDPPEVQLDFTPPLQINPTPRPGGDAEEGL